MACGCNSNKSRTPAKPYIVVLPGGKQKSYQSVIAAEALVRDTPGAYIVPPVAG